MPGVVRVLTAARLRRAGQFPGDGPNRQGVGDSVPPRPGRRCRAPSRGGGGLRHRRNPGPGAGCRRGGAGRVRRVARRRRAGRWRPAGASRRARKRGAAPPGRRRRRGGSRDDGRRPGRRNRDRNPSAGARDDGTKGRRGTLGCGERDLPDPRAAPGGERDAARFRRRVRFAGGSVPRAVRRSGRRLRTPEHCLSRIRRRDARRPPDRPAGGLARHQKRVLPDRYPGPRRARARPPRGGRSREIFTALSMRIRRRPGRVYLAGRGVREHQQSVAVADRVLRHSGGARGVPA